MSIHLFKLVTGETIIASLSDPASDVLDDGTKIFNLIRPMVVNPKTTEPDYAWVPGIDTTSVVPLKMDYVMLMTETFDEVLQEKYEELADHNP